MSHRGPLHLVAACLVLAALVRPVSLPATPGTLTLADAPVLTIDPACTFSSVVLQFRNDGPTPVTLAPAASEVTTVAGKPSGACFERPLGLDREPNRPVHREDQGEEDPSHEPVGVEQRKKRPMINSTFINQDTAKQIGESHAEQQGRTEVSYPQEGVPEAFPAR